MVAEDRVLKLEESLRIAQTNIEAISLMQEAIFQTLIHSEKDLLNKVGETLRTLRDQHNKEGSADGLMYFDRLVEHFEQKRGLPAND